MIVIGVIGVLAAFGGGDTLPLKEKARVSGRYVRLVDLLDSDRTGEAARVQITGVYLGRAPEEGQTRTITAEEIRRELERRGMDPEAFRFVGEKVEISAGGEPWIGESVRRAVAFEIKRHALERRADLRPEELSVRITHMNPEALPEGTEVLDLKPRQDSDWSRAEFTAVCSNPKDKGCVDVEVIARILRTREVAFAAREIPSNKVLERADVEIKRLEIAGDENYVTDLKPLLGGTALVRIRKGSAVSMLDVKMKPVVKRGDIVRASSSAFEVDARAIEDGAPGAEIQMEFLATKNRFRAKVIDAARVDVREVGK